MRLKIKGFNLNEPNLWDAGQVRLFCENAISHIGGSNVWAILSPPLRCAVVAQEAFSVCRSSAYATVKVDAMNALLHDMERLLGLAEE